MKGKSFLSSGSCITRLRFVLKDKSKVDEAGLREIKDIMGIGDCGVQYQIVIGGDVERVFNELSPLLPNVGNAYPLICPSILTTSF